VAAFVALGVVFPAAFHAVGLGKTFLPMHIPVLLAGLSCGPTVGLCTGAITPLLSAVTTGMPALAPPVAQGMVFELGAYGLLAGLLSRGRGGGSLAPLVGAMVGGRVIYGLQGSLVLPLFGLPRVPLLYPLTAGLVSGLPGVVLQIIVVPPAAAMIRRRGSRHGNGGEKNRASPH
jgi:hypothetical protein